MYRELSYELIGLLIEVHKELGCYAREKQCSDLFEKKLKERNKAYKRELRIGDSGNILDFVVEDKIVLEFKTVPFLLDEHYSQVKRYLHQSGHKLGLLVNFREQRLRPRRVLNSNNVIDTAEHP